MKWTDKQKQAKTLLCGPQTHTLLRGGGRSGKTFLALRQIAIRAQKAIGSRHLVARLRFTDVKTSIALDTWPKMMRLCFPDTRYRIDKTDWYASFPGGSEVWFGGLDDNERVDKILGREYCTIFLNEVSQIPYNTVEVVMTRLAQNVQQEFNGKKSQLKLKMFYDENPPSKGHWSYKLFFQGLHPVTRKPLVNPDDYKTFQMNPVDNAINLPPGYIDNILGNMSAAKRKRFLDGEFSEENPNAYFSQTNIDDNRLGINEALPDMLRVVVGVDPSGADDTEEQQNDAIGIVVGGLGVDGKAYLLEDCTVTAGPGTWGSIAAQAYKKHAADVVVGETNYGGAMVKFTVQVANPNINFKMVTASRGKVVRAEPFSALYEQCKIRHAGTFPELEEELMGFSNTGYIGEKSPNRADAWIWVLSELFPDVAQTGRYGGLIGSALK